jgi:hypothetical protein
MPSIIGSGNFGQPVGNEDKSNCLVPSDKTLRLNLKRLSRVHDIRWFE